MLRQIWPWLLIGAIPAIAVTSTVAPAAHVRMAALDDRERQMSGPLARNSQFSDVPHSTVQPRCEEIRPPQALTTPDPLLTSGHSGAKVKVSFIVGTDGRVHSPLILESAGPTGDRRVLQTVRSWRYRPATCNGVPTETEGKIEFSSR
jgi:TonB family protein